MGFQDDWHKCTVREKKVAQSALGLASDKLVFSDEIQKAEQVKMPDIGSSFAPFVLECFLCPLSVSIASDPVRTTRKMFEISE